jgi:FAD-dependent urate hydroxylase
MIKSRRSHRKALIVGGGIAGTVAAIALHKAGLEPVLVEAFDVAAEGVGAFLTIAPNGVRGLRVLDVDAGTLAAGFDTPRFEISLGNGRVLAELSAGAGEEGSTKTIRRADLYGGLRRDAERRGIRVEYGKRLAHAERVGEGIVARFEDGSELEADLLVGADGIHSRVRSILDPRAPGLHYLGLLNTGGFARGVEVPGPAGLVRFVFGRRCFFGWVLHPSGEVWWFANPGRSKEPSRAELSSITPDAWRAELLELFASDALPAAAIAATERIIGPWPAHDLTTVPVWHRDRMVVIGDAAHAASPSSGQGASMAIEDGLVLAKCLRDVSDTEAALAAYEQLRRARVERVVAQGRRNGSGKTPGPLGRVVRDLVLRLVLPRVTKGDPTAWIHAHRIDWIDGGAAPRVDATMHA